MHQRDIEINSFTKNTIVIAMILVGPQAAYAEDDVFSKSQVQSAVATPEATRINELAPPWLASGEGHKIIDSPNEIGVSAAPSPIRVPGFANAEPTKAMNPMADVKADEIIIVNELNSVSNKGLRFNHDGSALYFVGGGRAASIHKFVPLIVGDYSKGQTFILSIDGYKGDSSAKPKYPSNIPPERAGLAKWIALTDVEGNP